MNRKEWLQWRRGGLGSSDYPVIMGVSPWSTEYKLYESKALDVQEETNYAMSKGVEMEPRIRALYEFKADKKFEVKCLVMEQFPFMRVSLDGMSSDGEIIEIKYCNSKDYEVVKNGGVPKKYYPQVQGQLLVSGASKGTFLAYPFQKQTPKILKPELLAVADIKPDEEYQVKLLKACEKFWVEHVLKKNPPKSGEKDWTPLTGYSQAAKEYKEIDLEVKLLLEKQSFLKARLLEAAKNTGHNRVLCAGIKMSSITRVGAVSYKKIPELEGVDLEKYRAKPVVYWKLEV